MKIAPQSWNVWIPCIHTFQKHFLNVFSGSGTGAKTGNLSRFQNKSKVKLLVIQRPQSTVKSCYTTTNRLKPMLLAKREMEGVEYHLEPLKLLLPLHWCNWWSWMSMTLDHLASMGLHSCWVMMAAMNCCYGGPMTAGALWNGWNLEWTKYR